MISKFAVRKRVNTLVQDVAWYPYRSRRFNCFVAVLIAVFWREFVAVRGAALPDFFGEDRFWLDAILEHIEDYLVGRIAVDVYLLVLT